MNEKLASLTAWERELIINGNDAEDFLDIYTSQRPVITKLKANPAATLVEEGVHGRSPWARFTLPANLLTFRKGTRTTALSEGQRKAAGERLKKHRAKKA